MEPLEPPEVPIDMEFSEKNFLPRNTPTDDIPIMPSMGKYGTRLKSFKKMKDDKCPEEVEFLAKTGFYFSGIYVINQTHHIDPTTTRPQYLALCFCCGSQVTVDGRYPRSKPIQHFLHCKFFVNFVLPEEKRYLKDSIKPYRVEGEIVAANINEVRRLIYPERHFQELTKADIVTPPCGVCKTNEIEVQYHHCYHWSCIKCAKRQKKCPICAKAYAGLHRRYIH